MLSVSMTTAADAGSFGASGAFLAKPRLLQLKDLLLFSQELLEIEAELRKVAAELRELRRG